MINDKNNPLVSVIIPCYNHEDYIEECIQSVLNQTYKNIEIVVIDDGSTDSSHRIINALSISNNFYYEHQKNKGISRTLNKGLEISKSNLVTIISSDDKLLETAIEKFIEKYYEVGDAFSLIFGDSFFIDNNSRKVRINENREIANKDDSMIFDTFIDYYKYNKKELLNANYIGTYSSLLACNYIPVGVMFNKNVLLQVGGWSNDMKIEDYELWLRISKIYPLAYVNSITSYYRLHETNVTKKYKDVLAVNTAELLGNEKIFLEKYDVKREWSEAYNNNLLRFLKNKKIKLFIKYYDFKSNFIFHIIRKFWKYFE